MAAPFKFLVIDDNADSRFLLVKTLLRKFHLAVVHECRNSDAALAMATAAGLSAIVAHRTAETDGLALLRELRALNPRVPLIMVSGVDRHELALAAGADAFLLYDEWLRIGTVVEEVIQRRAAAASRDAADPPTTSGKNPMPTPENTTAVQAGIAARPVPKLDRLRTADSA